MEKWLRWAALEAAFRTTSASLQKVVGVVAVSMAGAFWATGVIGLVQIVVGGVNLRLRGRELFSTWREVGYSILFGLGAVIATVLGFITFLYQADLGTRTLMVTLSIIPGAFIDRVFFHHKLLPRQWLGLVVGLAAGYAVLDCPSLTEFLSFPIWVWLALFTTLVVAINQGVTQAIKDIDPLRKNFWGGLVAGACLLLAPLMSGAGRFFGSPDFYKLGGFSVLIGLLVVGLWAANVLSYRDGAYIALKKLVVNGFYLIGSMLVGVSFFHESFTIGKAAGVGLYLLAFALMDKSTWDLLTKKVFVRASPA